MNEYKSVAATRVVMNFYDADPARGFYGGGGLDTRATFGPLFWGMLDTPRGGAPAWGPEFKRQFERYNYTMRILGHGTLLPRWENSITLDPQLVDAWGRPGIRVTYDDHPDDLAFATFLQDRSV